jgi:hypothetical protein
VIAISAATYGPDWIKAPAVPSGLVGRGDAPPSPFASSAEPFGIFGRAAEDLAPPRGDVLAVGGAYPARKQGTWPTGIALSIGGLAPELPTLAYLFRMIPSRAYLP